ncbi:hypothetical protein FGSG_10486 [Fusarium graminearum PH-1]|uniref:Chromosome 1, complete genome n=1 Tax=Gibberella zeae (strain ATCC MYA-4620 / CBS 123657 / FGSC 9075 / NRRL 31084 / PH-1) TaxID=229533 RepID=I1S186_GIBZE|nr:hypothetical protein FGSG_10486 [Fusarium graminearum PH-1]ESU17210.1 hypothetical protein FGSG_10486 [Fusarium graminearum PH-1]EYB31428.1 hypothetical protein FG05_10486 [Fusarium graminearum]CEF75915.1 unnamed protein product [Fusarium graminearum]|eukprot:XP_011319472.1 hypothetical protein FGSG_10486 [Fusarium graminearum PH-1]
MKAEQSDGEESDDIDESNDDNEMATSPKGSGVLPPPDVTSRSKVAEYRPKKDCDFCGVAQIEPRKSTDALPTVVRKACCQKTQPAALGTSTHTGQSIAFSTLSLLAQPAPFPDTVQQTLPNNQSSGLTPSMNNLTYVNPFAAAFVSPTRIAATIAPPAATFAPRTATARKPPSNAGFSVQMRLHEHHYGDFRCHDKETKN